MIKLVPDPTFEHGVEIAVPGQESAQIATFIFRALSRKRLASLLVLTRIVPAGRIKRLIEFVRLCWRIKRIATVADLLDEIIVRWSEEHISAPYSRANLLLLLQEYPGAHLAIYTGYLQGLSEARRKN